MRQFAAERDTSTYAWIVAVLLLLVWMLNQLDRQLVFFIFPLLKDDLNLSSLQLGLLGTAFLCVYAVCSPLAGYVADRADRKLLICGSLFAWSCFTLLTAHTVSYASLVFLRVLMGVSEACFLPAALSLLSSYHSGRTRSRAMGLLYSGSYPGVVAGGVLGGALGAKLGWRFGFQLFGLIGCCYAASLLFALQDKPGSKQHLPQDVTRFSGAVQQLLQSPGYRQNLVVFAVASICDWVVYTWMPLYFYESFGLSLMKAGFNATFYMKTGSLVGLLLGGTLADLWARRAACARAYTQMGGLLFAALFLILAGCARAPLLLYAALLLFGLGKGAYDGSTVPVVGEQVPRNLLATAVGLLNAAGAFAGGAIAAAAGAAKKDYGLGHTFAACGVLVLITAALSISGISQRRSRS